MSELKPCLKKIHDLLDALDTTTCITLSPNILADKYYGVFDCDGCKSSEHYLGDLFDGDICLSCWKEAAEIGIQCIEDALRTENEAQAKEIAELKAKVEIAEAELANAIAEIEQAFPECNNKYIPFDYSEMNIHEAVDAMGCRIKELFDQNQRMVKEWELVEMKCNLSVARLVTTVDIDWLQRVMIRALQGGE